MSDDHQFLADVDTWIRDALSAGELGFGELVKMLPGVDPALVASQLRKSPALDTKVHWPEVAHSDQQESDLPVPHPLDFDWRFTPPTIAALTSELVGRTAVTLVGTPSLWISLKGRLPSSRLHLLDANPLLVRPPRSGVSKSQVRIVDVLTDPIPRIAPAEVVVVDPPWYPEVIEGFLWVAASLAIEGGEVWLSVPAPGTRPGVLMEREKLLEQAASYGLKLRSLREGALRYACPPFERATLRASGMLRFVPADWRKGDLFIFERIGSIVGDRPLAHQQRWTECSLEGVRIRVDTTSPARGENPQLISLLEGDVISSVSRRDPLRSVVRVWTSGNRVFGCEAPHRFLKIVEALHRKRTIPSSFSEVAARLLVLVDLERREYICSDDSRIVVPSSSGRGRTRTGSVANRRKQA